MPGGRHPLTGGGAPQLAAEAAGARVAVVATLWHRRMTDAMVASATNVILAADAEAMVLRVPGAFELPVVAKAAASAGFDAVVALGVVIRGGTPHFDYVCRAATDGLTQVAVLTGVPVGFGLLTCDTEEQALQRSGLPGSTEDKGREAAEAALATLRCLRDLHRECPPLAPGGGKSGHS